jgi:hypothetical protein
MYYVINDVYEMNVYGSVGIRRNTSFEQLSFEQSACE